MHRLRHLQYDEDRDIYVDPSVITQAARERVAAHAKKDKELRREAAKRRKFSQIDTLKGLSSLEYIEMRVLDFYSMQRTSQLSTF